MEERRHVVGLVLVDATHETIDFRAFALLVPEPISSHRWSQPRHRHYHYV